MKLILDTSALLSGKDFEISDEYNLYTTPAVASELKRGPSKTAEDDWSDTQRKFEVLIDVGLDVIAPTENAVGKCRAAAIRTGDIQRLSDTDIGLVALAQDLSGDSDEVVILTDDYSIQNLSVELGLKFKSVTERGITRKFRWKYKCSGCGKEWKEPIEICTICGAKVKTKIAKKEKL